MGKSWEMLGECFREAWGGLWRLVLSTLGLSGEAWEAWGMLGNASGRLGNASGRLMMYLRPPPFRVYICMA